MKGAAGIGFAVFVGLLAALLAWADGVHQPVGYGFGVMTGVGIGLWVAPELDSIYDKWKRDSRG